VKQLDRIYVTASARDARFTRICVASIRYFYPDAIIYLLAGGPLQAGLEDELICYWNVKRAEIPPGDYGWGFVKLEPLFRPAGERFLMLDSDTAFAGPVLGILQDSDAPFVVDDETQTPEDLIRLYYDWTRVRAVDPAAQAPAFVFNSGQWLGTSGILHRDDFAALLDWSMPPKLRYAGLFMPGDQGILNYVLNQKNARGLDVARRKNMRWPGHSMNGLDVQRVAGRQAPPLIVHWAGFKKTRFSPIPGSDLLYFFEKFYYSRLPLGHLRRYLAGLRYFLGEWRYRLKLRRARGIR
jgi:hypothetical protein